MWKVFLVVLLIGWGYRQIGVLRYKVKNAYTRESPSGCASVEVPLVPDFGRYLIWKYITRKLMRWRPEGNFLFLKEKDRRRTLWRYYKKIYLWPMDVWKRFRSDCRYGVYTFFARL